MKNFVKLLFGCAVLLLYSCTSVLYINTTLPPEVAVTNDQWKVVAINRFNPKLLSFTRDKKADVFTSGAGEAVYGATEAILQDETFSLAAIDTAGVYTAQFPNQMLSQDQVRALYQQHPHHLILALDNIDTFFDRETVGEKGSDGSVTKTAHYTLHTRTSWTLYDSTGAVLDRATLSRDELYNSRGVLSGLLAIGPAISNAGPVVNNLAWQPGMDYWRRLQPKHINFERPYYSNKDLHTSSL